MPVTTRLEERLRAIEAAENAKRSIRSPAPSPVPLSPPSSSPPARLPTRIINPLINIHGRRSLTHTLHHVHGDITATPFSDFPHPEPIYVPQAGEEKLSTGFSNAACYAAGEELQYLSSREEYEEYSDNDLRDYVSDTEQGYEYLSAPGASPAAPPSSLDAGEYTEAADIGNDLRGMKRKRSDKEGLLTGVEKFLDELPIGRFPAPPAIPSPVIPDAVPSPAKRPKLIPLSAIPMHPRAKAVLKRLQASYLAAQNPQPRLAPSLSPIVELPEKKCRFYKVESNYNPEEPNWVPEWPVNEMWKQGKGSLSPKISPTGNGTALYSIGCEGRKTKFGEIKEKMSPESVLNPEPARKTVALSGFREVVTGIKWQRLHDQERERVSRGAAANYRKTAVLNAGRRMSPVREQELFDPRWRDGVNRAQLPNVFSTGARR